MAKEMLNFTPPPVPPSDPSFERQPFEDGPFEDRPFEPPALPGHLAPQTGSPTDWAAPMPPPLPVSHAEAAPAEEAEAPRRVARRRPAGPPPPRGQAAANDDAPTIGGLLRALEQRPSNRPFQYAALFSALWAAVGVGITALHVVTEMDKGVTPLAIVATPITLISLAAVALPIGVVWFLALLAWRAEELRLRSSTMTEVAVRLAEPDRMAEQSIASLGQSVRRQVSFMNDAVSRAVGRAGELEALVQGEVHALERSYEENETRIRGLIQELSGERHALLNTSERVAQTLQHLGSEVPGLIDKLTEQQIKLSEIINAAGRNLTGLESAIGQGTTRLETVVGQGTARLESAIGLGATRLETAMDTRATALQGVLADTTGRVEGALATHAESLTARNEEVVLQLTAQSEQMQGVLETYTTALATVLTSRTEEMQGAFEEQVGKFDTALAGRTAALQTVFEEYARALDSTLANRAQALDVQLVERTAALDTAFNQRLQLFDDSIRRSTQAIDTAVSERAVVLTTALDAHAKTFRETIAKQSSDIDESIMHGINSVRRSSENITRQSLKAIEGLASQSEMLRNVSENLLGQINAVTNRFENQGQQILKAANALESANYKIDTTLQARHTDLSRTLERISGSAEDFGKVLTHYSSAIEGTVSEAEKKARLAAEELRIAAEQSATQGERAIEDLRRRFSSASGDVEQELGQLSNRLTDTTSQLRSRSAMAVAEIADEQARLRAQLDTLPRETRATAETMRRSLQEQLVALDQLQELAARTVHKRDVTPPLALGAPSPGAAGLGPPGSAAPPSAAAGGSLGALSGLLSRGERAAPAATQPAADQRWSFGDLLARASSEDDGAGHHASEPFVLNVGTIARALDPQTADTIWTRLRRGERGIMARNIYSAEGRIAYDEISRRVKTDTELQNTLTRFLADFERVLREAEARDPSGALIQQNLVSDNGRVYLFLAHASGRLV
jgi:hypothetical protein